MKRQQYKPSPIVEAMDALTNFLAEEKGVKEGEVLMNCDFSSVDRMAAYFKEHEFHPLPLKEGENVTKTYRG